MRKFNTTGPCIPRRHYMVDITDRLAQIKALIDDGKYFSMNRGRQYGKTTTINQLREYLRDEYLVVSMSFQKLGDAEFADEPTFVAAFVLLLERALRMGGATADVLEAASAMRASAKEGAYRLLELFLDLERLIMASPKPLVLIIDEVDSATNNQVFLDFLAQLRQAYIDRDTDDAPAFQSVILAGVTDVRHLRSKIRDEDQHKVNSPWNIADRYDVDMSFSAADVAGMLADYERDHATGMDVAARAAQVCDYTGGYPFLMSRVCQLVDEELEANWTEYGVDEAVRLLLQENNALFDSLMGKLQNYPELASRLRAMLMQGESMAWLPYDTVQQQLAMYGFICNIHNKVTVANRVFEMLLYVHFVGEGERYDALRQSAASGASVFVTKDGGLDVPKIMAHFIRDHNRIHEGMDQRFLEEEGRERFLTYLSPIVNGTGTYDVEPQTRDHRRMDVVVRWMGRRYVIELKIWRGERYNEEGEAQVEGYLDFFGLDVGYLLSFDFRRHKEPGVRRVQLPSGKLLFEGVV